jgi:hypothetical protein
LGDIVKQVKLPKFKYSPWIGEGFKKDIYSIKAGLNIPDIGTRQLQFVYQLTKAGKPAKLGRELQFVTIPPKGEYGKISPFQLGRKSISKIKGTPLEKVTFESWRKQPETFVKIGKVKYIKDELTGEVYRIYSPEYKQTSFSGAKRVEPGQGLKDFWNIPSSKILTKQFRKGLTTEKQVIIEKIIKLDEGKFLIGAKQTIRKYPLLEVKGKIAGDYETYLQRTVGLGKAEMPIKRFELPPLKTIKDPFGRIIKELPSPKPKNILKEIYGTKLKQIQKQVSKDLFSIKLPSQIKFKSLSVPKTKVLPTDLFNIPKMAGGLGLITSEYASGKLMYQKTLSPFSLEFVKVSPQIKSLQLTPQLKIQVKEIQMLKPVQILQIRQLQMPQLQVKQIQKVKQIQVKEIQMLKPVQILQIRQLHQLKLKTRLEQMQKFRQPTKIKYKEPTPRIPGKIIFKLPSRTKSMLKQAIIKYEKGYEVLLRSRGKIISVGKNLPYGKALAGTEQTFALKEMGTTTMADVKFEVPFNLYRTPKRARTQITPLTFVERRGKTLTTREEISSLLKAKKKGRRPRWF